MDSLNTKLPKPNIWGILIAGGFGAVIAVVIYQAQLRGLMPGFIQTANKTSIQETRTILQEENAIISVVDKTSPSVVAIGISKRVINPSDPFAPPQKIDSTIGTGFVISNGSSHDTQSKGVIVTNKHVVPDPIQYSIVTKDGQKYDVRKIYRDPNSDLAIIQIDANDLTPLELGDSSKLKVGQTMIAIGNALGKYTNTVTTGIVSGLGRKVAAGDVFDPSVERLDNLIQTDAAINPGNSGGPLLNSAGQVIGVNVAMTDGAQNIGFAMPINSVKKTVDEFLAKGFIQHPYLGIQYRFISKDIAALNSVLPGAYIQAVIDSSPASKVGIKSGDIITKIGDKAIDSEITVSDIISKSKIGQQLELTLYKDGKESQVKVILEEAPGQ